MAQGYGWKIEHEKNIPVNAAVDVSIGQVGKITGESVGDICGSGDVPRGVYFRDVDISEDGARTELMTRGIAVVTCSTAITDITLPVKAAASGTVAPVAANNDIIVGMPLNTALINESVSIDLAPLGTFYGA